MNEWISEWANQCVSEWLWEWVNEWVNEWISVWANDYGTDWTNEWMSVWMNELVNNWVKIWVNKWVYEWVREWIFHFFIHSSNSTRSVPMYSRWVVQCDKQRLLMCSTTWHLNAFIISTNSFGLIIVFSVVMFDSFGNIYFQRCFPFCWWQLLVGARLYEWVNCISAQILKKQNIWPTQKSKINNYWICIGLRLQLEMSRNQNLLSNQHDLFCILVGQNVGLISR